MNRSAVRSTLAGLRSTLDAIDAGTLDASTDQRAFIAGAITALEGIVGEESRNERT